MTINFAEAIVLDTETTGLSQPEPIEIALLYLKPLSEYKEFIEEMENMVNVLPFTVIRHKPTKPIDPHASKVHGIYLEHLEEFPTYNAELFVQQHLPASVQYIIGHTINFDLTTLNCIPGGSDQHFDHLKPIEVCKIAKKLWPEFKEGRGGYKLVQITEKLFPELKLLIESKAHGALADVYFTYLILAAIIFQHEPESWEDVYQLQVK